jgi:hypothetical protein
MTLTRWLTYLTTVAIVTLCEFRNSGLWVVKGNEENGFIVERHKLSDQEFKIGLEVLNTKGNDGLNN